MHFRGRQVTSVTRRNRIVVGCTVLVAVLIGCATLWPHPIDRPLTGTIAQVLDALHSWGVPQFVNYTMVEFTANMVMFVPFGLCVALLCPRKLWWCAVVAGAALSVAVELTQLVLLPARFATLSDVVANTGGALLGAALALLVRSRPKAPR